MKAVVITAPGDPDVLALHDVATPEPGVGQLRVRVHASALNRADLLQRRGRYPAPSGAPADVPGLEYAGTVDAVGAGVARLRPGDRVMGLAGGGAHAEYVVVHEREAVRVPAELPLDAAAAVPEAFVTAYDALFDRLLLRPGERLLVHAAGSGVGTAAIQLARAAGARVTGTARSAWKLDRAAALGLELAIDTTRDDFCDVVLDHTGGEGLDAVLDLVGGPFTPASLRALRTLGRLVLVGTVAGRAAEIDLGLVLSRRLTVVGTVLRSRPLEEKIAAARGLESYVVPLLAAGAVRPVVDRVLPFAEIGEAHRAMEANENFGKIVLRWD